MTLNVHDFVRYIIIIIIFKVNRRPIGFNYILLNPCKDTIEIIGGFTIIQLYDR